MMKWIILEWTCAIILRCQQRPHWQRCNRSQTLNLERASWTRVDWQMWRFASTRRIARSLKAITPLRPCRAAVQRHTKYLAKRCHRWRSMSSHNSRHLCPSRCEVKSLSIIDRSTTIWTTQIAIRWTPKTQQHHQTHRSHHLSQLAPLSISRPSWRTNTRAASSRRVHLRMTKALRVRKIPRHFHPSRRSTVSSAVKIPLSSLCVTISICRVIACAMIVHPLTEVNVKKFYKCCLCFFNSIFHCCTV